jgi:methylphosphotriester-DNA--protein-cysteine methyltransferase
MSPFRNEYAIVEQLLEYVQSPLKSFNDSAHLSTIVLHKNIVTSPTSSSHPGTIKKGIFRRFDCTKPSRSLLRTTPGNRPDSDLKILPSTMAVAMPYRDGMPEPYQQYDYPSYTTLWPSHSTNTTTLTTLTQSASRQPTNQFSTPTTRWQALVSRNPSATNAFIYAVLTTKIYCRPDCSSRLARRANVRFYDTAAQAEEAGFRACKRCKPDRQRRTTQTTVSSSTASTPGLTNASTPSSIETRDDEDEENISTKISRAVILVREAAREGRVMSLADLSTQVKLSKFHLQRVFKKLQGLTPREMAEGIIRRGDVANESHQSGKPSLMGNESHTVHPSTLTGAGIDLLDWSLSDYSPLVVSPDMTWTSDDEVLWQEQFPMMGLSSTDPFVDLNFQVPDNDVLAELFPELFSGQHPPS